MAVFSLSAVVNDRGHSLSLGGEVETDKIFGQVMLSNLFNISLEALHHNKHSLFSC
jgi:hypothetical protein